MRSRRLREFRWLGQSHIAIEYLRYNSDWSLSSSKPRTLWGHHLLKTYFNKVERTTFPSVAKLRFEQSFLDAGPGTLSEGPHHFWKNQELKNLEPVKEHIWNSFSKSQFGQIQNTWGYKKGQLILVHYFLTTANICSISEPITLLIQGCPSLS